MKILKLYESIAEALDITVDNDLFFINDGEELLPATQKAGGVSRQLVLPTYERIKAGFKDELHPFHPLCESVIEGQSPTIKWMQKYMRRAIQLRGLVLIDEVLKVAAGKKKPRSAVYASLIAKVTEGIKNAKMDEMLLKSWGKLLNDTINDGTKIPRIFLDANKEIDGKKYSRVCYYSHKFIDEAEDGSQFFFKTKLLRKSDKVILLRLCNEIFGMFPSETGSNDDRPYFASLMRGYRDFVMKYNKIAHSLHEVVKVPKINDEWVEHIDELDKYEEKIQTLAFNAGDASTKPRKETKSISDMQKPVTASPAMASAKETPPQPGKMSVSDLAAMSKGGNGGKLGVGGAPVVMSEAERRYRERTGNSGAVDMFAQNQNNNMFATQNSMFDNNQSSMFSGNNNGSMFGNSNDSLFGNNNNQGSMFGNNSNNSMFGNNQKSMF